MFKAERLAKIKEILLKENQVSVTSLASLLDSTSVTIRSDLEQLERTGFLQRIHGGAILRDPNVSLVHPTEGEITLPSIPCLSKEKWDIACVASEYIQENDWVFLDSGSTCCAIALQIVNKATNVITNSIVAAYILSQNPKINVVVPGGVMESCSYPFVYGDILLENLQKMHINKAFISVGAADLKFGYSVSHPQEGNLLDILKEHSDELIIVSDSTKFHKSSFMRIGDLDVANLVISDKGLPQEFINYYEDHQVRLLLA